MSKGAATLQSVQRQSAVMRHPHRSWCTWLLYAAGVRAAHTGVRGWCTQLVYVVRLPLVLLTDRLRSCVTRLPIKLKQRLVQLPMLALYFMSAVLRLPLSCARVRADARASVAARVCAPATL